MSGCAKSRDASACLALKGSRGLGSQFNGFWGGVHDPMASSWTVKGV